MNTARDRELQPGRAENGLKKEKLTDMFDFSIVTSWIHGLLTSLMPLGLAVFLELSLIHISEPTRH